MTHKVGFDLENSYFYVHGSNVADVMRVGSSLPQTSVRLYAGDDETNGAYNIGIDTGDPSLFWIGQPPSIPALCIRDTNVGIGITEPLHRLDIDGNLHLTGRIMQTGSNAAIQSDLVEVSNISAATPVGINMNGSRMYNVGSFDMMGTHRQVMNGTQNIRALRSTGIVDTQGVQTTYLTVSWAAAAYASVLEPSFQVDVSFFAGGAHTRASINASVLVNVQGATLDVVLDKHSFQSDNINSIDVFVNPITSSAAHIGVTWTINEAVQHKGHLKVDVTAPVELTGLTVR